MIINNNDNDNRQIANCNCSNSNSNSKSDNKNVMLNIGFPLISSDKYLLIFINAFFS